MALFGLLLMTLIQFLNDYEIPRKGKDLITYLIGIFFILISGSIGAIVALPFYLVAGISKSKQSFTSIFLTIILSVSPLFIASSPYFVSRVNDRFSYLDRKIETFGKKRGYNRIKKFPEYIFLGSGEGAYERFCFYGSVCDYELHATFAGVLFSYGLIGLFLLIVSIYQILSPFSVQLIFLLTPIFSYSLVHYTLRSSFLWILFAIIYIKNKKKY